MKTPRVFYAVHLPGGGTSRFPADTAPVPVDWLEALEAFRARTPEAAIADIELTFENRPTRFEAYWWRAASLEIDYRPEGTRWD